MKFELGDKVRLLDDERVATVLAILPDPMQGGEFQTLPGTGINMMANVPTYKVAPKQFTDDDGNFTDEPVYYIQGVDWWSWAVAHELTLDKPVQRKLL
jgi:hypothetical protein